MKRATYVCVLKQFSSNEKILHNYNMSWHKSSYQRKKAVFIFRFRNIMQYIVLQFFCRIKQYILYCSYMIFTENRLLIRNICCAIK